MCVCVCVCEKERERERQLIWSNEALSSGVWSEIKRVRTERGKWKMNKEREVVVWGKFIWIFPKGEAPI